MAKVPFPFPSKIETVLASEFATARSGLPSPLTSPIATERGLVAGTVADRCREGAVPVPQQD